MPYDGAAESGASPPLENASSFAVGKVHAKCHVWVDLRAQPLFSTIPSATEIARLTGSGR